MLIQRYHSISSSYVSKDFKIAFQRLLTLVEIIADGEIDLTIFKNQPKQLELQTTKVLKINKRS